MVAGDAPLEKKWAKGTAPSIAQLSRSHPMTESGKLFAGSIPKLYDTLMVPLISEA